MTTCAIERDWLHPGIACLWISNPSHRNAMNDELIEQMIAAVGALARDPACRLIVVRGRGGIFSAGRQLNDLRRLQDGPMADVQATYERLRVLNAAFHECPVPTLAVIERFAYGAGATIVVSRAAAMPSPMACWQSATAITQPRANMPAWRSGSPRKTR